MRTRIVFAGPRKKNSIDSQYLAKVLRKRINAGAAGFFTIIAKN
jgi:hypothetical protein